MSESEAVSLVWLEGPFDRGRVSDIFSREGFLLKFVPFSRRPRAVKAKSDNKSRPPPPPPGTGVSFTSSSDTLTLLPDVKLDTKR